MRFPHTQLLIDQGLSQPRGSVHRRCIRRSAFIRTLLMRSPLSSKQGVNHTQAQSPREKLSFPLLALGIDSQAFLPGRHGAATGKGSRALQRWKRFEGELWDARGLVQNWELRSSSLASKRSSVLGDQTSRSDQDHPDISGFDLHRQL